MSIEDTIRGMMKKPAAEQITEAADKVGDGPKVAPGNTMGTDEPNVKRNNTNQSVIAKSNLKKGSVKGNASAPESKHPSHFSAPGQTREEAELEGEEIEQEDDEYTVDVSEDVEALMNGEDLSEEFKTKATTIFEAAVVSRVKSEVARLEEEFEQRLQEQFEEAAEGLVEQVDGYLNLMVEKWLEDNALALESGLKSEITESFILSLKDVFAEHFIDVPEEKLDVLSSLEEEVAELTAKLDESVALTVDLTKSLSEMKRAEMVAEAAAGLTDAEAEKFSKLAEELVFEGAESFSTKLQTIREGYFAKKAAGAKMLNESVVTDAPVEVDTAAPKLDSRMAAYTNVLSKFNK